MSGHTPGPWLHDVMYDGSFMIREPHVLDHAIANVDNVWNARLIAAAPDLLAALAALVDASWSGLSTQLRVPSEAAVKTALAALDKARS